MKKDLKVFLSAFAVLTLLSAKVVFSEPRETGLFQSNLVIIDNGDSIRPFTVAVGTTTPVLVYYSTQTAAPRISNYGSPDRNLVIQNITAFNLFCSTLSTVSSLSGNRFVILSTAAGRGDTFFQTYSAPFRLYCVFDPSAGAGTKEVLGYVEYDSAD